MKRLLVMAAALGALSAGPAVSEDADKPFPIYVTYLVGEDLWRACGATDAGPAPDVCTAYVMGAVEGLTVASAGHDNPTCMAKGVDPDQIVAAVRSYLAADPKRQGQDTGAIFLVRDAVNKAFPCHQMFIKRAAPGQ